MTTVHVPRHRVGEELINGLSRGIERERTDVRHTTIDLDLGGRESRGATAQKNQR